MSPDSSYPKILICGAGGQLGMDFQAIRHEFETFRFLFAEKKTLDVTREVEFRQYLEENRPALVINCAAYTNVEQAETDTRMNDLVNSFAPGMMAGECAALGIPFIHISTDYVFDGNFDRPITEEAPPNPINAYGRAKLAGEKTVQSAGGKYFIIRTSWLYSTFGHNFMKTIKKLAAAHGKLSVVNDQWGSPTYARTFARDLMQMAGKIVRKKDVAPGIYHYSQEGIATWYDFAKAIAGTWKLGVPVHAVSSGHFQTKAMRPKYSKLDAAKFTKATGIKIARWEKSLLDCYADEQKEKEK